MKSTNSAVRRSDNKTALPQSTNLIQRTIKNRVKEVPLDDLMDSIEVDETIGEWVAEQVEKAVKLTKAEKEALPFSIGYKIVPFLRKKDFKNNLEDFKD